ncbi:ABC-type Mn2+/Zn2+ transport system permease subunit [Pantoea agglomerans]
MCYRSSADPTLFTCAAGVGAGVAEWGYLSFFIDSAPAPTIVVLFALVFIVAMVISGRKTRQLERQRLNAS